MRQLRYREALREAMFEEMELDERVFLMGEEVGHYQGAYKVSEGLLEKYGERRVIDTPIAEAGFAGVGIGAAMVGLRPIIEFMTWNFSFVAFDQIISNAAKVHQMSAGKISVPIVFRGPNGAAKQVASQHSHSAAPFYTSIPGLYVVQPSTPRDAKPGLYRGSIRLTERGLGKPVVLPVAFRVRGPDRGGAGAGTRARHHGFLELRQRHRLLACTYGLDHPGGTDLDLRNVS